MMLYIYHCREGHLEVVTNLITSHNADVNSTDRYGVTPLQKAHE